MAKPGQYWVTSFTTIKDLTNTYYTITLFDGMGRVRAVASDHPKGKDSTSGNEILNYRAQYNAYDVMGRLTQFSPPTEIDGTWAPAGDDLAGYLWNYQDYRPVGIMELLVL